MDFIKNYVGNIAGIRTKKIVDNIADIHKYEIKETTGLGFLTFQEIYRCSYWGLGVEYALEDEE